MMLDPTQFGERIINVLANDHGEEYWQKVIEMNGTAWLRIAEAARHEKDDLYDGNISRLKTEAVFIHGRLDPRTEPDELEKVQQQLPHIPIRLIDVGKHSPHSERLAAPVTISLARQFFDSVHPFVKSL